MRPDHLGSLYLFAKAAVNGITDYQTVQTWETTYGEVAQSKLVNLGRQTEASIWYTYQVNGQTYWSNRISIDGTCAVYSPNDFRRLDEHDIARSEVGVFYDHANPEKSVVYRNFSTGTWTNIVSFLFFTTLIADFLLRKVELLCKPQERDLCHRPLLEEQILRQSPMMILL